jgi:hypothetical protein
MLHEGVTWIDLKMIWHVAPCNPSQIYWRFIGPYCLHHPPNDGGIKEYWFERAPNYQPAWGIHMSQSGPIQVFEILRLSIIKHDNWILIRGIAIVWFILLSISVYQAVAVHTLYKWLFKELSFPVWLWLMREKYLISGNFSLLFFSVKHWSDWEVLFYVDPSVSGIHWL